MAGHENPVNSSYNGGEIEALTATFRLNAGLLADKHSQGIPTTGKSTDLFGAYCLITYSNIKGLKIALFDSLSPL